MFFHRGNLTPDEVEELVRLALFLRELPEILGIDEHIFAQAAGIIYGYEIAMGGEEALACAIQNLRNGAEIAKSLGNGPGSWH